LLSGENGGGGLICPQASTTVLAQQDRKRRV
jgi:hypothetical protein